MAAFETEPDSRSSQLFIAAPGQKQTKQSRYSEWSEANYQPMFKRQCVTLSVGILVIFGGYMRHAAYTLIILLFASTSAVSQILPVKQDVQPPFKPDVQVMVDTIEDLKIQEEVLSINGSAFIPISTDTYKQSFRFSTSRTNLYITTTSKWLEDKEVITLTAPVNLPNGATIKRIIADFDVRNENSIGSAEITLQILPPYAMPSIEMAKIVFKKHDDNHYRYETKMISQPTVNTLDNYYYLQITMRAEDNLDGVKIVYWVGQ